MPGLAEMHAHVPPVDDIEPMKEVLKLFLYNGITTIRGMLGHPRHLELRSKIKSGEIIGPHFYTSGPSFNGNTVKTPESGAQMVRDQKQAGYDFLKLHPGLTKENFAAIAKTAHEVKIPFAGHVSYDVGVWRAIEAGYASIDHLDGFVESLVPGIENVPEQQAGPFAMYIAKNADRKKIPALMKALKEKNIWVVPTQALAERWFSPVKNAEAFASEPEMIYMKEETLKNWVNSKKTIMNNPNYKADEINNFIELRRQLIAECQRNGVGLLLGSDGPQVFNVPGFSVHHELRYMVDAGLTPYQALQSGTVNVAKYFNLVNSGMIKPGYRSDLILLDGTRWKISVIQEKLPA
jgi:imidazolonepropionase-like amidohydrolase